MPSDTEAEAAEPFLTEEEAATALAISLRTLQRYRFNGAGPVFYRLGPRRVRYRQTDLQAWQAAARQGASAA